MSFVVPDLKPNNIKAGDFVSHFADAEEDVSQLNIRTKSGSLPSPTGCNCTLTVLVFLMLQL